MPDYITREEWDALQSHLMTRIGGVAADIKAAIGESRAPSKAALIGGMRSADRSEQAGAFLTALLALKGNDPEAYVAAKASMAELGSSWMDVPADSKATLGTTDAAGGWIVPNAMVDAIVKPAPKKVGILDLVTVVPGINSFQVDIPLRNAAPSRMTIQSRGSTKENKDLAYDGYSATMYTLARIYDLASQFVRQSAGAAERDVIGELTDAARRGTEYYLISGAGSTEPYGLKTALTNAPAAFTSSFTAGATLAGSIIAAVGTAAGALAGRDVTPNAALINAQTLWTALLQGDDQAGFYMNGANDRVNRADLPAGTVLTRWGIPLVPDSLVAADDLIVGDYSTLKVYEGDTLRIDSSNVAGERWDKNLTGFRGEKEIALDARPAVYAGNFQLIEDITP